MLLNRNITRWINYALDNLLPPFIRDSKLIFCFVFRIFFGSAAATFFSFKSRAFKISKDEFVRIYDQTASAHIQRDTDLNSLCFQRLLNAASGKILEVGCGRGSLSGKLTEKFSVTACDIRITPEQINKFPGVQFIEAAADRLPFADRTFETVICTHTLEHVQDFSVAISELRRVCSKQLLIVVPCQRPYRYTFDLHVRFFPYEFTVLDYFQPDKNATAFQLEKLGGDWFYRESYAATK